MTNEELIKSLKENSNNLSKEQMSGIIETASRAFVDNQPFLSEEEVAEQTITGFIQQLAKSDRETIETAKKKILSLI